ncbi:MAG: hypothetical protein VB137_06070 [Burkholderia sp.]
MRAFVMSGALAFSGQVLAEVGVGLHLVMPLPVRALQRAQLERRLAERVAQPADLIIEILSLLDQVGDVTVDRAPGLVQRGSVGPQATPTEASEVSIDASGLAPPARAIGLGSGRRGRSGASLPGAFAASTRLSRQRYPYERLGGVPKIVLISYLTPKQA